MDLVQIDFFTDPKCLPVYLTNKIIPTSVEKKVRVFRNGSTKKRVVFKGTREV